MTTINIHLSEEKLREFLIEQGWTPPASDASSEPRYAVSAVEAEAAAARAHLGTREGLGMRSRAEDDMDFHYGDYCEGVRDALRWATTGTTAENMERYVTDDEY